MHYIVSVIPLTSIDRSTFRIFITGISNKADWLIVEIDVGEVSFSSAL